LNKKHIAHADCVNNMTSIIPACSLLAKERYVKYMIECVLNYTVTYAGKQEQNQTILIRTHTQKSE